MVIRKRITVSQIAKKLAKRTRLPAADIAFIVTAYCEEVVKNILAEKRVYLQDIGTLEVSRGKQTVRNWVTGEVKMMKNYPKIRFKMSNKLRANYRRVLVGRWRRENPVE